MANADITKSSFQDMMQCVICTKEFDDSRVLPCIHTFCLKCLEKAGENKQPGENMPCPHCGKQFKIPLEGFREIKKNFFMDRLIEIFKIDRKTFCELCCDNIEKANNPVSSETAAIYCVECNQKICEGCGRRHKRNKILKDHKLINLNSPHNLEELSRNFASSFCNKHKFESIKIFCHDCELTICLICFAESHQLHQCSDINKIAEDFRKHLESDRNRLVRCLSESLQKTTETDKKKESFQEHITKLKAKVIKSASDIKQLVNEHETKLLQDLETKKTKLENLVKINKEKIIKHIDMLDNLEKYTREMEKKGSSADICRSVKDLNARAVELEQLHKSFIQENHLDIYYYEFHTMEDVWKIDTINILGKIKILVTNEEEIAVDEVNDSLADSEEKPGTIQNSELIQTNKLEISTAESKDRKKSKQPPVGRKDRQILNENPALGGSCQALTASTTPLKETISASNDELAQSKCAPVEHLKECKLKIVDSDGINDIKVMAEVEVKEGTVNGVTWLENKIYVICDKCSTIFIFADQDPFNRLEEIRTNKLTDPADITSSSVSRAIFVIDYYNKSLWKFQMPNKHGAKFPVDVQPYAVSLNSTNELLLLCREWTIGPKDSKEVRLYIYRATNVSLSKSIGLPKEIVQPQHVVSSAKGTFIILHQEKIELDLQKRVFFITEISAAGKIIRTFNLSLSGTVSPWHLAIDKEQRIFIGDREANRLVCLDSQLTKYQIFSESNSCLSVNKPWKLSYVREKHQLIVGQRTTPRGSFLILSLNTKY